MSTSRTTARPPTSLDIEATAYSGRGETAAGTNARRGVVAADPHVLPIGSRIRVANAGQYSGDYLVADTGRKIKGRKIDIYIPSRNAARKFGKRSVHVDVLKYGGGPADARAESARSAH